MRPAEFTDEHIVQAGQQLQVAHPNRRVTASAIRMALGGVT